jgi:NO-binding membrane sensor protein with MHYT domain
MSYRIFLCHFAFHEYMLILGYTPVFTLFSLILVVSFTFQGLCLDSGDINRLMMKKLCVVSGIEGNNDISVIHRCRGMWVLFLGILFFTI